MDEVLHDTVAARLRAIEQRYTTGRRALVNMLAEAGRPVTSAEVTAAATVPASTAYRNLAVLEQAGVVRRVQGSDDFSRYELAEEFTNHHHHLVCVSCGNVEDVTVPPGLERNLDRAITKITTGTGFTAQSHRLDLLGTCGDCS